jgi:threonyl-tRNA synthetase
VGTLENWEKATHALEQALSAKKLQYEIDQGQGVFYGPKIDLKIRDCLGRFWQCSTVQVDFNLPEQFDVTYRDEGGKEQRAIMVHRALLGSVERFMGVLIEHYAGAFPVWLAPVQVKILTITDRQNEWAKEVAKKLADQGFRIETDMRNEKIGLKIREATLQKVPYMAVVGEREAKERKIALRKLNGEDAGTLSVEELAQRLGRDVQKRS